MSLSINGTTGLTMNDGSAIVSGEQVARAWVNFNGVGTVAIRDSYNVASITDNGTGDYTVNFSSAMPNANYAAFVSSIGSALANAQTVVGQIDSTVSPTTTAIRVNEKLTAGAGGADSTIVMVSVFAGN